MKKALTITAITISCSLMFMMIVSGCGTDEPGVELKDPSKEPVLGASAEELLNIDDVLGMEAVTEYRISPDGLYVAWVVGAERLYLAEVEDGNERQVDVPGSSTIAHIAWSPDSTKLAFAADAPSGGGAEPGTLTWPALTGTR